MALMVTSKIGGGSEWVSLGTLTNAVTVSDQKSEGYGNRYITLPDGWKELRAIVSDGGARQADFYIMAVDLTDGDTFYDWHWVSAIKNNEISVEVVVTSGGKRIYVRNYGVQGAYVKSGIVLKCWYR